MRLRKKKAVGRSSFKHTNWKESEELGPTELFETNYQVLGIDDKRSDELLKWSAKKCFFQSA